MKELKTVRGSGQGGRGPSLASKRERSEPGQRRRQHEPDRRGHEDQGARPLQQGILRAVDHDAPAERGQPAIRGEIDLIVDGVDQLRRPIPALEQPPNHGDAHVVHQVLHADPRAMEDELALTVHDENVAPGDLDR